MLDVQQAIVDAANRYGVRADLALEVAIAESGMNVNVSDSPRGAIGIFQLEPGTASDMGVDPRDPQQNIEGGVRYLAELLSRFSQDPMVAVAAYNWGPSHVMDAIAEYGSDFGVIAAPGAQTMPAWLASAPAETQNYVAKIFRNLSTQYSAIPSSGPNQTGDQQNAPGGATSVPPGNRGIDTQTALVLGAAALLLAWAVSEALA